jgi:hypothetical protein
VDRPPIWQDTGVTTTEHDTRIIPSTNDGDHERFAHYVKKGDIVRSAVEGMPIEALCGKVWIPDRDPKKYPVCPTCKEVLAKLKKR